MNLNINNSQFSYLRKGLMNSENNKNFKLKSDLENKKIDEEQDKLDREYYDKSIMLHTAFTYEEFKNNTSMFPPRNAPGIVRKAWRELGAKATTEKEALQLMGFGMHCSEILNKTNKFLPTDFDCYLNIAGEMEKFVERYRNCPGVSNLYYGEMKNIADSFYSILNKYMPQGF